MKVQHGRQGLEDDAFDGLLQTVLARRILILAVQRLRLHVVLERLVDWRRGRRGGGDGGEGKGWVRYSH